MGRNVKWTTEIKRANHRVLLISLTEKVSREVKNAGSKVRTYFRIGEPRAHLLVEATQQKEGEKIKIWEYEEKVDQGWRENKAKHAFWERTEGEHQCVRDISSFGHGNKTLNQADVDKCMDSSTCVMCSLWGSRLLPSYPSLFLTNVLPVKTSLNSLTAVGWV